MPLKNPRALAAATAVILVLTACGDGGGDDEAAAETTVPTTRPILTTTLPSTTVPSTDGTAYTVEAGDTLGRIAVDHGVSLERLLSFNGIQADTVLQPGHKLLIPPVEGEATGEGETDEDAELPLGAQTYVIEAGDTFNAIAERFEITLEELLAANDLSADAVLHPGDEIVIPAPTTPSSTTSAPDG